MSPRCSGDDAELLNVEQIVTQSTVEVLRVSIFPWAPRCDVKRFHRREGFEADNADGMFESAFTDQVQDVDWVLAASKRPNHICYTGD